jgi:hypothetical protein
MMSSRKFNLELSVDGNTICDIQLALAHILDNISLGETNMFGNDEDYDYNFWIKENKDDSVCVKMEVMEFGKENKNGNVFVEDDLTPEQVAKIIAEAPDVCPISGMDKCESYIFGGQAVYLTVPAYDAYTLPIYDPEDKSFSRFHYDMDDDNRESFEHMCCLDELKDREDYEDIKKFFDIKED